MVSLAIAGSRCGITTGIRRTSRCRHRS
jgi:hypothetical protein